MPYWIKERNNHQLGVYYVGCGEMTVREAKASKSVMHRYPTKEAYTQRIAELNVAGEQVLET